VDDADTETAPASRPGLRRWWDVVRRNPRRSVVALAVAAAALILVMWLIPDRVETVTVERREVVETLVSTGRVRSVSRTSLGASLVATVDRVLVEEGDVVAAGELVIELDSHELAAAAAEARARVAAAEAALGGVVAGELPGARADLAAAETEVRQLERDVERMRTVFEAGGASRQEVERVERLAGDARTRLERATATARGLSAGGADRRTAEAGVVQARESLAAAEARFEQTRIRSTAAGTVLVRSVEPGDAVQPGTVLMEIALDGPTELIVFPDERSLSDLRPGLTALASADAYPDQTFHASVDRIAPVIDPQQGTVEVRLGVHDPPAYLLPDMTVSVNIELVRRPRAPTLPLEAVRALTSDTAWVLAVRDGRATPVRVRIGARGKQFVEIAAGVREGERVIADPDADIAAGDRVRARDRR
jgi:HlyD family secretion protein